MLGPSGLFFFVTHATILSEGARTCRDGAGKLLHTVRVQQEIP
jgi:hypothetical protein